MLLQTGPTEATYIPPVTMRVRCRMSFSTYRLGVILVAALLVLFFGVFHFLKLPEKVMVSDIEREVAFAVTTTGPTVAYHLLKIRYADTTPMVRHTMAHIFGETLYSKSGLSGFSVCDTDFNYGCYHGFLLRAVSENGLDVVTSLDDACFEADPNRPSTCQHGLGHGILEYLGEKNVVQALQICKTLREVEEYAGCTAGVFMDYNIFATRTPEGEYTVDSRAIQSDVDLYTPCTDIPEEFRSSCYHELPQWWNTHYRMEFKRQGEFCNGIASESGKRACYFGLGGIIAGFSQYNRIQSVTACKEMPTESGIKTCIARVARAIDLNTDHHEVAVELCNTYAPDEPRCPHK